MNGVEVPWWLWVAVATLWSVLACAVFGVGRWFK